MTEEEEEPCENNLLVTMRAKKVQKPRQQEAPGRKGDPVHPSVKYK